MSSTNNKSNTGNGIIIEVTENIPQPDNTNDQYPDMMQLIFNKTNYIFVLWFLAIYVLVYFLMNLVFKKPADASNFPIRLSRGIDFIVLITLIIFLFVTYFNNTESTREMVYQDVIGTYTRYIENPISIFSTAFLLFGFYIIINLLQIPMTFDTKPAVISLLETIGWITFIIICFVDFFKYVLLVSIVDLISDSVGLHKFRRMPRVHGNVVTGNAVTGNVVTGNAVTGNLTLSQPIQKDEVFNITNNLYTYDDAQSICSAYGAKLATYDQIEDAYNNGAEWCNYGWSDGQMAFFPTQKDTWNKLQQTKNRKNDCGRPGVNGGYFGNPLLRFGVNCFGKKPPPSQADLDRMAANKDINLPQREEDVAINNKVNYWRQNMGNLLVLNSFDRTQWSEY